MMSKHNFHLMTVIILVSILFALISCNNRTSNNQTQQDVAFANDTILSPLEIDLDDIEWKTTRLTGKNKAIEDGFVDMRSTLWKKGDTLIFRNAEFQRDNYYLAYLLPDLKLIKKFGIWGIGPNEFEWPEITISRNDDKRIGCIYDWGNGNYYELNNDFTIKRIGAFKDLPYRTADVSFYNDSTAFYLGDASLKGRNIYKYTKSKGLPGEAIHNLVLNPPGVDFFYAYDGAYGYNVPKNRLVYAYKFFREIHIMDMNGKLLRTLKGKDGNRTRREDGIKAWMDNFEVPCYYEYCYPTDKYFYLVYSDGHTLGEFVNKTAKEESIIEQYDWNGNPVQRFVLDKACHKHLLIDEKEKKIYINVYQEDDPLYIYDLKDLI